MRNTLAFAVLGAAALLVGSAQTAPAQTINGGGSTFVAPLMEKWSGVYKKDKDVKINYISVGSGAGIEQLLAGTVDFCCSDAPLNQKQIEDAKGKGGEVLHIPVALGGIVPAYNLEGVDKPLRLSGKVLADIFMGNITKWNDEAIKELNAGVDLPAKPITVVHRSDSSGSTYILTNYLSKVSPQWKDKIGTGSSVKFPVGTAAKGTEAVAAVIKETSGSIGYVELLYALQNKMKFGSVKNKEGNYVQGSLEGVTAAAEGALGDLPADLRFSLTNAAGKDAYPLSGCTWALIFARQPQDKGQRMLDFLKWATHDGQEHNTDLYYARLPKGIVEKVDTRLGEAKIGK